VSVSPDRRGWRCGRRRRIVIVRGWYRFIVVGGRGSRGGGGLGLEGFEIGSAAWGFGGIDSRLDSGISNCDCALVTRVLLAAIAIATLGLVGTAITRHDIFQRRRWLGLLLQLRRPHLLLFPLLLHRHIRIHFVLDIISSTTTSIATIDILLLLLLLLLPRQELRRALELRELLAVFPLQGLLFALEEAAPLAQLLVGTLPAAHFAIDPGGKLRKAHKGSLGPGWSAPASPESAHPVPRYACAAGVVLRAAAAAGRGPGFQPRSWQLRNVGGTQDTGRTAAGMRGRGRGRQASAEHGAPAGFDDRRGRHVV
jgi:hypothetical protein